MTEARGIAIAFALARFCLRIGENPIHRRRSENPSSEKVIREKDFLECSIFRPPKNGDYGVVTTSVQLSLHRAVSS